MGVCFLSLVLVLSLFFWHASCQQLNTDAFFVSDFFKKMGLPSSKLHSMSAHVCSWQSVFCDATQENVIGLVASGLGLSGSIPETTIGKLRKLQTLDLSNNKITGFSSDFWSLGSNLRNLNLSYNQMSGSLPNDIGNLGLAEVIDLSFNSFSGNVPESFNSLLSLQVLKLNDNAFTGILPSGILSCRSLVSIDMSSNQINGFVPEGFGAAFSKLQSLNLAVNEIHGSSSDFMGLKALTYLNISRNLFNGSVSSFFKESSLLEVIDLSQNQFQGDISQVNLDSTFNWSHLVFVDLSTNQLSGDFTNALSEAHNLKHLNLAQNRFSKQNFPNLGKVLSLEYLNLSQTNVVGEIPSEVSQLVSLQILDLSKNHLTGRIPSLSIGYLQVIELSMNNLTGEVPLSLVKKLSRMEKFNFSYNNLTLCASELSHKTFETAFIGSLTSCPIAANPDFFRRKTTKYNELKLVLAITFSIFCFTTGFLCLAFGCRRNAKLWVGKNTICKEEQNKAGSYSFQTDSTNWVSEMKLGTEVPVVIFEKPLLNIKFADLLSATSHFSQETLVAEGRSGPVYRGFLPGGFNVAMKVLANVSTVTDEEIAREFDIIGQIKHSNLIPLMGYCLAADQRIAIYEYMENGNLQYLLHDYLPLSIQITADLSTVETKNGGQHVGFEDLLTTWRFRHKIALGIARALAFLHHGCSPPIIHRDVKASSIYLDSNLEPRLSSFGYINVCLEEMTPTSSLGYAAPELCEEDCHHDATSLKSDIYGFGVVLFELLTGKKPVGDDYTDAKESNLVSWMRGLIKKNQSFNAVDRKIRDIKLQSQMQIEEAMKIGYLCTADLPSKRPSMHQIVGLLKDIEPQ